MNVLKTIAGSFIIYFVGAGILWFVVGGTRAEGHYGLLALGAAIVTLAIILEDAIRFSTAGKSDSEKQL